MAEFHTELERLPSKEVQENVYIKHPVSLEQYIMEGSYNKVFLLKRIYQSTIYLHTQIDIHWNKREVSPVKCNVYCLHSSNNRKVLLAKGNVPAESYKYFIDILMTTVRY